MPDLETYCVNYLNCKINQQESTVLLGYNTVNKKVIMLNTLILETKWYIWKNRNNVKYGNKPSSHMTLYCDIKKAVKQNILSTKNKFLMDEYVRLCEKGI